MSQYFNVVQEFHEEFNFLVKFPKPHIIGMFIDNESLDHNSRISEDIEFSNVYGLCLVESLPKR